MPLPGATTVDVMSTSSGLGPSQVIARFSETFARHDPTDLRALLAPDCVLHTTGPAPAGAQVRGREACGRYWGELISDRAVRFLVEDEVAAGDVVVQQWRVLDAGGSLLQRGINVFTVVDGLISSADGYLKAGE